MRQGCCPEEVPGRRGRGWVPGRAGGRNAGERGAQDAGSNQLSELGSPTFRSPECLSGRRTGLVKP